MTEPAPTMTLHDLPAGMHPRRVRIVLAEKGLDVPRRVIDVGAMENATEAFLSLNPLGTLPVLSLPGGEAIAESLAICRYLEALHPEPPLFGTDPAETARIDMWTLRCEFELSRPIADVFVHESEFHRTRSVQVQAIADAARARALGTLDWLDRELATRTHIADESYTMADVVAQCALVLGKAVGVRIVDRQTHLGRWFDTVCARPTARA